MFVNVKRYYWDFVVSGDTDVVVENVRIKSRPTLKVKEVEEINFLSAPTWIPSKAEWESIVVYIEDVGNLEPLYDHLREVFDFSEDKSEEPEEKPAQTYLLRMSNGSGILLETWKIIGKIESFNFCDLDHSSCSPPIIELKIGIEQVFYDKFEHADGGVSS